MPKEITTDKNVPENDGFIRSCATNKTNRDELAGDFRCLAHNFFHMNWMPHEMVAAYVSHNGNTENAKWMANNWAEYLETIAQLVREQAE